MGLGDEELGSSSDADTASELLLVSLLSDADAILEL